MVNVAKHRGVRNKTQVRIENSELVKLVSLMVCEIMSSSSQEQKLLGYAVGGWVTSEVLNYVCRPLLLDSVLEVPDLDFQSVL
jgi:hypothetical protein